MKETETAVRYPGRPAALDGSSAVVAMETAASEGAGAYPITPSTQMGEGWAAAVAAGTPNVFGKRLVFFEPEGEHAAAAVTAGLSMTGMRATNFSSGQGVAYMHESLYAAVGKRLTYVLHMATRAMTKHALNVHCGHDDYHAVEDTGFFQVFAASVQEAADLALVAHRIAELALTPGVCAQDGFLTSHVIESLRLPEPDLIRTFLGDPADTIESPTPAQRLVFGATRRRIPQLVDVDYPTMLGVVQNQDSYAQGVAAQRPFYFDHVAELADRAFEEYAALTGRRYARATGYRLDDADYVLAGQGSLVENAQAAADYLRETRGLKVGVLNLTMFRPFPADAVARLLGGKKAVTVLERVDQPLAADPPLLREMRGAVAMAIENGRATHGARANGGRSWRRREASANGGTPPAMLPYPTVPAYGAEAAPAFYSGCFGMGSRDLQPGDIIAAVENMLEGGAGRRQFYLGIDFIRPGTPLPKLQIWQEALLDAYPHVGELALPRSEDVSLLPKGAVAVRIHSVGGWGAMTMGKNLTLTVSELLGLEVKANPKYGSEKKGQPTTFYTAFADEHIRLNCELRHVDVVLSPDPNVFRHSNPLAGLAEGGVFVIQASGDPADLWSTLPADARRAIRAKKIRVFALDAFAIAMSEASNPELRYRMQGAAFMGAFFRAAPLAERHGMTEETLFAGIRAQMAKKFGRLGERVVEDNIRVIRRGYDELVELDLATLADDDIEFRPLPATPASVTASHTAPGLADPGRFWEQVCFLQQTGEDGIADPFAAISAIPAATGAFRDLTGIRFEVPAFVASKCTGCAQCWVQCPDAAIPAVVSEIDAVLDAALRTAEADGDGTLDRVRQVTKHLAREARVQLKSAPFTTFADTLRAAYDAVAPKLGWDAERRSALDAEFARVHGALAAFPLAKTQPFFETPETKAKGTGGLLSIVINPFACKGCNLCVDVCPEGALITVKQDDARVAEMRRNWALWEKLPETPDRYVNVASVDEGIGVLSSLLLKKSTYFSMVGGDGSCMGCGEKTGAHLVLSAVHALLAPRVAAHLTHLDTLIHDLDAKARALLASSADLESAAHAATHHVDVELDDSQQTRLARLTGLLAQLRDLRWRYTEGPGGTGRAKLAMANSTGCSSVWASTYPYNPYPFPWVNHLFQDAPSIAIGLFEGHMRKMADGFTVVRRAALELADGYDPAVHEPFFQHFDWHEFTDEEFALCPPIIAIGGDGAMFDIGFQNLSRLLASGKPIKVIVLDTQVYSNTGGQACTSGFFGEISDMAAFGAGQHGKEEHRKELALIAMAHRSAFVLQSSQASPSHLLAGAIRGLVQRRPAVFLLYTPCPAEHGIADDAAYRAARLALESRAVPFLVYDPSAGPTTADALSLEGNPAVDDAWPTYELTYVDDAGAKKSLTLPVTIADWAATEARFAKHFTRVRSGAEDGEEMTPFHEYLTLPVEERAGRTPFIYVLEGEHLGRLGVSEEMVQLAEERQRLWNELRQLAGVTISTAARDTVTGELEGGFEARLAALTAEYEAKIADLKARYPAAIARRLAERLVTGANGGLPSLEELMAAAPLTSLPPLPAVGAPAAPQPAPTAAAKTAPAAATAVETEEGLGLEPFIESARCTTCNECTNLNAKMFAYNEKKQAYVKNARAGTFQQLVLAAERCPAAIIHPGTPLNPKEKDLAKWVKRAERFA